MILLLLALTYRGGTPEEPEWMSPHWWGILGLIGWAYLVCSTVYLLAGERIWIVFTCWIILHALNAQEFVPVAGGGKVFRIMVSASNHALVMSGVLATLIYQLLKKYPRKFLFPAVLFLAAAIMIAYGFSVRPFWGISNILATPAWTAVCAGISYGVFAVIYIVTDVFGYRGWASVIMPAGRSTLTCYLVPTLVYPILWPIQQHLPEDLLQGWAGLVKSFLFALLVILLTGVLEKIKIRMKI
jgi:hypothetical protein